MNTPGLYIFRASDQLAARDLKLIDLDCDSFGTPLDPPVRFAFGLDPERFHFVATRDHSATCHPDARPGAFQAELWKFDAAEFFLGDPSTGRYLEFNLAPNGAWWSCLFDAPRHRISEEDDPIPEVATEAKVAPGSWRASATLPRAWLEEQLQLGSASRLNATFILDSPAQRFVTAGPPGPGEPDFHRPGAFPPVIFSGCSKDCRG